MQRRYSIKTEYFSLIKHFEAEDRLAFWDALVAYITDAEFIELPGPVGALLDLVRTDIDKRDRSKT